MRTNLEPWAVLPPLECSPDASSVRCEESSSGVWSLGALRTVPSVVTHCRKSTLLYDNGQSAVK